MDFERFDGFWRRLAKDQLGLPEALPVGALLAKALETWTGCIVCNLLRLRAFDVIARWQAALVSDLAERRDFLRCETWCNRHGWLVIELSSPRDLGRLHRQLLLAPKARMIWGGCGAVRPRRSSPVWSASASVRSVRTKRRSCETSSMIWCRA